MAEDDLALVHCLIDDPGATGEHEWHGWQDMGWVRRRWDENRMLGEDVGMLMIARGDEVLGLVSWRKKVTGYRSFCWNIGISLAPEARGHGYGSGAQRLLARYLFAHTQVARIEAETEVTNIAEQRALEKAGFSREGVLRGYVFRDGRWRDDALYSMIRADIDLDGEGAQTPD